MRASHSAHGRHLRPRISAWQGAAAAAALAGGASGAGSAAPAAGALGGEPPSPPPPGCSRGERRMGSSAACGARAA